MPPQIPSPIQSAPPQVTFNEDAQFGARIAYGPQQPAFIRVLLSTGIVKTPKQAEYALLGIAVAALLLAVFFLLGSAEPRGGGINPKDPLQVEKMQAEATLMP